MSTKIEDCPKRSKKVQQSQKTMFFIENLNMLGNLKMLGKFYIAPTVENQSIDQRSPQWKIGQPTVENRAQNRAHNSANTF